jgi:hypothetical protein
MLSHQNKSAEIPEDIFRKFNAYPHKNLKELLPYEWKLKKNNSGSTTNIATTNPN